MTLPKGFGSGGGGSSSDVSKMIGRRMEDHAGIITGIFIGCWLATWSGVAVATVFYPWAYPPPSAHYALSVLTIIESIGYLFAIKVATVGTNKAWTYNYLVVVVLVAMSVATFI